MTTSGIPDRLRRLAGGAISDGSASDASAGGSPVSNWDGAATQSPGFMQPELREQSDLGFDHHGLDNFDEALQGILPSMRADATVGSGRAMRGSPAAAPPAAERRTDASSSLLVRGSQLASILLLFGGIVYAVWRWMQTLKGPKPAAAATNREDAVLFMKNPSDGQEDEEAMVGGMLGGEYGDSCSDATSCASEEAEAVAKSAAQQSVKQADAKRTSASSVKSKRPAAPAAVSLDDDPDFLPFTGPDPVGTA